MTATLVKPKVQPKKPRNNTPPQWKVVAYRADIYTKLVSRAFASKEEAKAHGEDNKEKWFKSHFVVTQNASDMVKYPLTAPTHWGM